MRAVSRVSEGIRLAPDWLGEDAAQAENLDDYDDVSGAGHTWPGRFQYLPVSIIGKTCRTLNASAAIWRFFAGLLPLRKYPGS